MDMKKMMKQAQKMQAELAKAQEEVATLTSEASAGGGVVKAVAAGDGSIMSITIDPAAVDPEDVEMLQDLVLTAVNDSLRQVSELANIRMSAVTNGLNIPGL
ncbi:MAG: YbaB/EbfC family nucleoid-associated protein [Coriobacteriales bacterium]|jgi:DNA-binding YbaB/EbfC family protein|nr:YbaB/EbfC family nucleoid-associated protein [Coriobacteriales bacterium]